MNVLLEAAAQVFHREGMGANANRIAQRAGPSIGTLYRYFPNKRALLCALAERHVADAASALERVFDRLRRDVPPFEDTMRIAGGGGRIAGKRHVPGVIWTHCRHSSSGCPPRRSST